uniref:Cell surface protein n=1 Tax=Solibacter usitatus (strain Ellin6076) TaxID=234267 RepID=Q01WH1_SOLUE
MLAAVSAFGATVQGPPKAISFRLDVMPVFFRAGCNSGGCHGAAVGKDGFHLSLFGYDPAGDYYRLTQQIVARRVDVAAPAQSLLLMKATGMVPHSGGRRFKPDSEYYTTLLKWIEAGALDDAASVPTVTGISLSPDNVVFAGKDRKRALQVIAKYSDGTTRVVNNLALYLTNNKNTADINDAGVVTGDKRGDTFVFARFAKYTEGAEVIVLPDGKFKWPKLTANNYIDELVYAKLQKLRVLPSAVCTDEQFLRRAYLDVIGLPPTAEEYRAFLADRAADKRANLIDSLLARDEYADLWATKWADWLKVRSDNNSAFGTDRKAAFAYYEWIREQMKRNAPLDEFVKAQVAGAGSNLHNPPVNLYTMLPQGQLDAKGVAQDVAQVFTGMRVQCAQCHNHPFDRWTQEDYYGFVSFFTGVKRKVASEAREFYIYDDVSAPPAKHLLDGHPVPARFLGGDAPDVKGKDPRVALAEWLTAKDNAIFRQNMANRLWAQFFGRGIVDPVDDVRISNPPSNRELLEELGKRLAGYNFDARKLIRDICLSKTYQLAATPNETNRDDDSQFSHQRLRRLRADVILDALAQVTETPSTFNEMPRGVRAMQLYEGGSRGNYFLKTFGSAARDSVNASETRLEPTLAQALHMVNGDTIEGKLAQSKLIPRMLAAGKKPGEIVDELFIRALSRRPSENEMKKMMAIVSASPGDKSAYDDVVWALVNSTEFEFNH